VAGDVGTWIVEAEVEAVHTPRLHADMRYKVIGSYEKMGSVQ
jgi:hypothetical protein